MRAVMVLLAAVMLGLTGGYAWSAMTAGPPRVHVPKAHNPKPPPIPETAADKQWAERADDSAAAAQAQPVYYAGCAEARAAGHAPLHAGEPGYRSEMDGDGDGIACEPYNGN